MEETTFKTLPSFNTLISHCAIVNMLDPEVSFQKITLAPNETIIITISIKDGYYSIEDELFIYSENPDAIQYSIEIDSETVVPAVTMLPTQTGNTEKVIFRKGRIKKDQIKITFTNLDLYNSTKVSFKSWIDYINIANYKTIISPIIDLIRKEIFILGKQEV